MILPANWTTEPPWSAAGIFQAMLAGIPHELSTEINMKSLNFVAEIQLNHYFWRFDG